MKLKILTTSAKEILKSGTRVFIAGNDETICVYRPTQWKPVMEIESPKIEFHAKGENTETEMVISGKIFVGTTEAVWRRVVLTLG